MIMIIKETDNITLDIYWKKWTSFTQRSNYLSKTRDIAENVDKDAIVSSRKQGCTFIKMELPHLKMESYHHVDDNEHRYDYQKVHQLLDILEKDDDVSSVQLEINDSEKGGVNYHIDHYCKVIQYDEEGIPCIVQLYPLQ